jgi:MFS family permease
MQLETHLKDFALSRAKTPSTGTLRGLDWLNFFLADVQTGVGPFLAIYLQGYRWNEQSVGLALTVGSIAGILTQTPAGALVDRLRSKRALIAAGVVALSLGAMLIALLPSFWLVMSAQVLIGGAASIFAPAICAVSLGIVGHSCFDRRQGRNQTFNSAGNVVSAIAMGLLGYYVSNRSIFFLCRSARFRPF